MDFLLSNGHSKSWMIGNTTVTITTSGTYIGLDGVCENCLSLRERTVAKADGDKSDMLSKTDPEIKGRVKEPRGTESARAGVKDVNKDLSKSSFDSEGSKKNDALDENTKGNATDGEIREPRQDGHFSIEETKIDAEVSSSETRQIPTLKLLSDPKPPEPKRSSDFLPSATKNASEKNPLNCQCVCQGWAEILIRRPSGNISWIMRLQNRFTCPESSFGLFGADSVSTAVVDDPQISDCKYSVWYVLLIIHLVNIVGS